MSWFGGGEPKAEEMERLRGIKTADLPRQSDLQLLMLVAGILVNAHTADDELRDELYRRARR